MPVSKKSLTGDAEAFKSLSGGAPVPTVFSRPHNFGAAAKESAVPSKNDALTLFVLFLIAFAWGFNYVIVKNVYSALAPFTYCASRFIAAGLLLMAIAWYRQGANPLITDRKDLGLLALISFGGFGASNLLMAVALDYTLAATTSIILSTSPLITLIIAPLFKIDKFSLKKLAAILFSLAGVYFIFVDGGSAAAAGANYRFGVALAFMATIAWSVYSVFSKPLLARYSPLTLTANVVFISSLMMVPFAARELAATDWLGLPGFVYASYAFSIIFSTVLPMIFWNVCIKKAGPVTTMTFSNLTPAFAMLTGYILLREPVSVNQIAGALIVIISVVTAYL